MFQKQNDNSDSEGVESDLEKSEISEVEEDQPVESTYLQNLIAKEKISWCPPDPSSDRYGIECELESLQDIEITVEGMKPVLKELDVCGKVIIRRG